MNTILGSSSRSSNLVGTSIAGTSVTNDGMELPINFCGAGAVSAVEDLISSEFNSSSKVDCSIKLEFVVVLIDSSCNDSMAFNREKSD